VSRVSVALAGGWRRHLDPSWLEAWQPVPFDLGDGTTEVVAIGAGPPLLLLPPLPGFKEAWVAVAGRLARSFRVVTFDLRERPRSWNVLLADLDRVADTYAPGPAAVAGHSLGGALALHWAIRRPDRVSALVLSSSFARVGGARGHWRKRYLEQSLVLASQRWLPEALAARLAARHAGRGTWVFDERCDEHILGFVRHAIRTLPIATARGALRVAFAHDLTAELPRITCPTLVVVGERESEWARAAAAELARSIPGATLRVSPGVAHLHPLSGAEWLAATVGEWLLRLRGASPGATVPSCDAR
jgi:pimeloyl-ACP methyl ester carboxylesterase